MGEAKRILPIGRRLLDKTLVLLLELMSPYQATMLGVLTSFNFSRR